MVKVLLCDKESIFSKLIARELKQLNCKILIVDNGLDGVKLLEKEKPDLLITDLFLPLINGFEFISLARKTNPDIVIVVYSEVKIDSLIEHIFRLGANDFIAKPFDVDEFSNRVKHLLIN